MSDDCNPSGTWCECEKCKHEPRFQDENPRFQHGKCQGCDRNDKVNYVWVATGPEDPRPNREPKFTEETVEELKRIWRDFLLLRGLSPHLDGRADSQQDAGSPRGDGQDGLKELGYRSAPWYRERGLDFKVTVTGIQDEREFCEQLNRASDWTNKAFLLRLYATLESHAAGGGGNKSILWPHYCGIREVQHLRRLRNEIAHGNDLKNPYDVDEAKQLFGKDGHEAEVVKDGECLLPIDAVIEPLWARVLMYVAKIVNPNGGDPRRVVVATTSLQDPYAVLPQGAASTATTMTEKLIHCHPHGQHGPAGDDRGE